MGAWRAAKAEAESSHELQARSDCIAELQSRELPLRGSESESLVSRGLEETMDTDLQEAQKELLEEPVEYISRKEQELWQECWCARRRNTSPSSSCTAAELASA